MARPTREEPVASVLSLTLRGLLGRIRPDREPPEAGLPEPPAPEPMSLALALALDRLRRGGALGPEDQAELLAAAERLAATQAVDLTAADLMSASPQTLAPGADWRAMSAEFVQHGRKTLPVVDPQGQFLGLIALQSLLRPGAQGLTARHLLQAAPALRPEAPFAEVLAGLVPGDRGLLPVVAEDGRLLGLITRTDVMAGLILAMVHS